MNEEYIKKLSEDEDLRLESQAFFNKLCEYRYSYNFEWQGRPIIQFPQDIVAMQELIWRVRPDLIIETGIAHGGSLVFSASLLALLDMIDAIEKNETFHPKISRRKVLGIDIDIREHNRKAIEDHPMASRIQMIEGSSIAGETIQQVRAISEKFSRVLVCLDSNHTHAHVLEELRAYAPLVSVESYCVVFDTVVEYMPKSLFPDRPWGPGDNPLSAVNEFLKENKSFLNDEAFSQKLVLTVAPCGYLRRVS